MRQRFLTLFIGVAVLAVVGCSSDDGSGTPSDSSTISIEPRGLPQGDGPLIDPSVPLPTTLDGDGRIPVNGYAVIDLIFGESEQVAIDKLSMLLGRPDNRFATHGCSIDPSGGRYQVLVKWGAFTVTFRAADAAAGSPRVLVAWSISLQVMNHPGEVPVEGEDSAPVPADTPTEQPTTVWPSVPDGPRISVDGAPIDVLMFEELQANDPDGYMTVGPWAGSQVFVASNGVRFVGYSQPDFIYAGEVLFCD